MKFSHSVSHTLSLLLNDIMYSPYHACCDRRLLVMLFSHNPPADYLEAIDLCDETDLRFVEGLWTYPQDDVTVLTIRNDTKKGVYDIFVVESADCSPSPGMRIGEMFESAGPDKFNLKLFTK